jgi:threonine synthase
MLYLTTRDKFDTHTAYRAMREDRAPNGGFYLPFRMPVFTGEELAQLKSKSFGQNVAEVLELFFGCGLSGWDVEFAIGRYPVKLTALGQRIWAGELWHNQENSYAHLERALCDRICPDLLGKPVPSWMKIAVRIAALFALYGEMLRGCAVEPEKTFDIALPAGDFSAAMAVWYTRQMGLPVENIICGCNENSAVWELLHIGELRTDAAAVKTATPEADIGVPDELERLVCAALGAVEAQRYVEICGRGGVYSPRPGMLDPLRKGMYGAVVSGERLLGLIPSVYRTGGYVLDPYSALAYGGLQDYRAKTGTHRTALLLCDRSPLCDRALVCAATGFSEKELKSRLER